MVLGLVLAWLFAPAALAAAPVLFVGSTTSTVDLDSAMKIYFNDPIVENVVSDAELLNLFLYDNNVQYEKTTGGRYIETAQYFALPTGVGARARGEYIPVPEGPVIKNSKIFLKKLQGVVEMEGDVMARVRTDMGAYVDWMERALPDLVTRLNDSVDRMLIGYGAGILARVNEAVPDATIPVDTAFGVTLGGTALTKAWLNFMEGDRIVFSATPARHGAAERGRQPVGQDHRASTRTPQHRHGRCPPAGAVADNDFIFMGDGAGSSNQTAAGDDREIMGLLGMVDDGTILATFQGLARGTYNLWKSISLDATNVANDGAANGVLTEDLLTFTDDQTMVLGAGKPDMIVTSRFGLRSYWKSLKSDRQINDPRSYHRRQGPGVGHLRRPHGAAQGRAEDAAASSPSASRPTRSSGGRSTASSGTTRPARSGTG
jgi:hypothetical protein